MLAALVLITVAPGVAAEEISSPADVRSPSISDTVPEPPRFGFKPVDEDDGLRATQRRMLANEHPPSASATPAYPLTPNDLPHQQRRGPGTERLPDLQTYGRNPEIRRYGTLSGSSGIPRGVRPSHGRP